MSTDKNCIRALEDEARNRELYLAFAEKADEEDQHQLARIFRAAAESELVHARAQVRRLGLVGSCEENLKYAVAAEEREFQDNYAGYLREARQEGNRLAAAMFARFLRVERGHYKLFRDLLARFHSGSTIADEPVCVCPECGNTVMGPRQDPCEICGRGGAEFVTIA
jgi:rubrerythrin